MMLAMTLLRGVGWRWWKLTKPVLSNGRGGVHGGGRNNDNDDDGSEDEFLFLNAVSEFLDK